MSRIRGDTALGWVPTDVQSAAIDWLAMGYSQNATAIRIGVTQQAVSSWVNDVSYAEQFRAAVAERAALFAANLEHIELQQVLQATAVIGRALAGEIERDRRGELPAEFIAAVELLRPRWRANAGERNKRFGA
jgi:transcriptional regulator with XRE-family HTH domain